MQKEEFINLKIGSYIKIKDDLTENYERWGQEGDYNKYIESLKGTVQKISSVGSNDIGDVDAPFVRNNDKEDWVIRLEAVEKEINKKEYPEYWL